MVTAEADGQQNSNSNGYKKKSNSNLDNYLFPFIPYEKIFVGW
jgi:hypothetical protein